jgi:hypothetical protein
MNCDVVYMLYVFFVNCAWQQRFVYLCSLGLWLGVVVQTVGCFCGRIVRIVSIAPFHRHIGRGLTLNVDPTGRGALAKSMFRAPLH